MAMSDPGYQEKENSRKHFLRKNNADENNAKQWK
jgi:hypothetical protein